MKKLTFDQLTGYFVRYMSASPESLERQKRRSSEQYFIQEVFGVKPNGKLLFSFFPKEGKQISIVVENIAEFVREDIAVDQLKLRLPFEKGGEVSILDSGHTKQELVWDIKFLEVNEYEVSLRMNVTGCFRNKKQQILLDSSIGTFEMLLPIHRIGADIAFGRFFAKGFSFGEFAIKALDPENDE